VVGQLARARFRAEGALAAYFAGTANYPWTEADAQIGIIALPGARLDRFGLQVLPKS